MKKFAGTPGTMTGLSLRIAQFLFAAASIVSMASTSSFFNFTAFCYLIAAMGLQVTWSLGLALLDAYAVLSQQVLHNPIMVTATLSLAAASASGGIAVLYFHDLGGCIIGDECQKYQLSVAFAFLSWITVFISSLIMFFLLAAG
ncbi:hypothetical protein KSS87_010908 [Heliosperma pusillum]|nr:hypothetical protein KSS87_010908 [Heliosperma pusillum]